MSENKFIKHLRGEQTAKSVLEIKNQRTTTSFANMPEGTSNANDVYSDHRGNATGVLKGSENWKLDGQGLVETTTVYGDGRDLTSDYEASGNGLWVDATIAFATARRFNANTKFVLKLCGHDLETVINHTVDFTLIVKFGTSNLISKTFTVTEQAFDFCKEFVIDFAESNSSTIKADAGSTMQVQLLCADANARATIYDGMTVFTALQRRVDGEAVASDTKTFPEIEQDIDDINDEIDQIHEDIDDLEDYVDDTFVRLDGESIMTGPLKMRATSSFQCAIAPFWDGVGFYKLNSDNSVTLMASIEYNSGFEPSTTNTYNIGALTRKWKNLYLSGKAYISTINNGYDLAVPAKSGTLATMGDVDLAANSGDQLTEKGVWYAKMYSATVAPSAEDGTNYADFSQTDNQGNPIIVIYKRQNGAWVQDQTITPPAEYNGYVPVTSKIWDIVEQAGQQGGKVLWSHNQKTFTPSPLIISFEDIEVTGDSTVIMPNNPTDNNIPSKKYVDDAVAEAASQAGYHPDLFDHKWSDHELDNMSWVNALTFSWKDSSFYEAAYDHLVDDITTTTLLPYVTLNGNNYYRTPSFDEPGQNHPYAYVYDNHSGTIDIKYSDFSTGAISETYWPSATATTGGIVANDGGQEYIPAKQYETISGVTIGYYVTSDGHKIVDAADENLVASIYTATGVAWYYILDETNQRFKLPRSRFQVDTTKLIKSLDNSNKTAISFPYTATEDGYVGACLKYVDGTIGSISVNNIVVFNNTTRYNGSYLIGFESVGIYVKKGDIITISGFSNDTSYFMPYETVTTDQRLYFYVGNYTQTAIENTAGLNASLFNGKADTDLGNVSAGIDFVVESQLPTAQNNYTWYRKYKSGWVEQGGIVLDSESGNYTVNLPVAMADTNYDIQLTCKQDANGALAYYMNQTTTSFVREATNRGGTTAGRETKWRVEGMAA